MNLMRSLLAIFSSSISASLAFLASVISWSIVRSVRLPSSSITSLDVLSLSAMPLALSPSARPAPAVSTSRCS